MKTANKSDIQAEIFELEQQLDVPFAHRIYNSIGLALRQEEKEKDSVLLMKDAKAFSAKEKETYERIRKQLLNLK